MNEKEESKTPRLVIKRTFKASPERVWKAWTDPDIVRIWWGPRGYTNPVSKIDLWAGGRFLSCMRSPDGQDVWSTGVYKEIVPPSKLVYTDAFSDADGNIIPAFRYGFTGDFPKESLVTLRFHRKGDSTEMELEHSGMPEGAMSEMTRMGWNESFDKLAEYLETGRVSVPRTIVVANPGAQEVVIKRTFDAPRSLVFRAYTDPGLIPHWWGPARYKTTVERLDARTGGSWRFLQKDVEGNMFAFRGVYHEVKPPELIIQTFEFEPNAGHVQIQTASFEEREGKTAFIAKSVYLSVEDRDRELSQGMAAGMNEGFDRLDALLERMKRESSRS